MNVLNSKSEKFITSEIIDSNELGEIYNYFDPGRKLKFVGSDFSSKFFFFLVFSLPNWQKTEALWFFSYQ
jgi:hypothetical protein